MVGLTNDIAEVFPAELILYISHDDCQVKILLKVIISKKKTVILMHLENKVTLPDHNFLVGMQHKLMPPVMTSCLRSFFSIS